MSTLLCAREWELMWSLVILCISVCLWVSIYNCVCVYLCDSQAAEGDGSLSVFVNIFTLLRLPWLRAYSPDTHTHTAPPTHRETSTHTCRTSLWRKRTSTLSSNYRLWHKRASAYTHTHTCTLTHSSAKGKLNYLTKSVICFVIFSTIFMNYDFFFLLDDFIAEF